MPARSPVEALRAACAELGIVVAWDGTVDEAGAAALLHRSPSTLKDWRLGRCALSLEWVRIGNRTRYRLEAIADFLAKEPVGSVGN